jgi:signal transduction histidine kinase
MPKNIWRPNKSTMSISGDIWGSPHVKALFHSHLFVRAFTTTTASVALLFAVLYAVSVPFIESSVENIEERAARTVLDNVHEMVEQIEQNLESRRKSLVEARKQELRDIVSVAESRARRLLQEVRAGRLDKAQARQRLLDELRDIRYGQGDYVWASDYRSVLVSHPDPKLNNADFSQRRDTRGNLIVPPMVAGGRENGEGFHSYWWRRLGEEQQIEKLSFYRHLPEFELVIGTGVYIDDIEKMLEQRRASATDELRQRLRKLRIAKTGYVYIFDSRMHMHIHPNTNIEHTNITTRLEPLSGKPIGALVMSVADRPEGMRYKWDHPDNPGRYIYDKISWVSYFKGFDWYIASSVYVDELQESARVLKNRLLAAFAITLLFSIALIYLFVNRLVDPLKRLAETAHRVESGDLAARCELRRDDEIGVVALAFNGMVERLQDNIAHLDARVRERTVELESAYEELKELDRLKSDFLSTVSHELRTPMTSVFGFAKLVKKKLEEMIFPKVQKSPKTDKVISQVRENLDIITHESERLTRLINDVLDSAKLDAGKVEWDFQPLSPAWLLERAAAVTAVLPEQKGLTFSRLCEARQAVLGDEHRLLQVLINLISNAVKFTEQGSIVLSAVEEDGHVRFCVRDTGTGIAPEDQEKVFDKFRQICDTLTDKPQGTGLGLSICRQIIEHHGGRIWVSSCPGEGSVFCFTVPLAKT